MTIEARQVQEVIFRSRAVLAQCMVAELSRAIRCCRIAKLKGCEFDSLPYLMVAEATSARFKKLHLQGKILESEYVLDLMGQLEEELGAVAHES